MTKAWRSFVRGFWTLVTLMVQSTVAFWLVSFNVGAIIALLQGEFEFAHRAEVKGYWLGVTMLVIVLPLITGTWLAAGLGHLRRGAVYAGWIGVNSLVLLIIGLAVGLAGGVDGVPGSVFREMTYGERAWSGVRDVFLPGLAWFALMTLVSLGGIPIGRVTQRGYGFMRSRLWRSMHKRRRLRRSAV
jgi:hypothetical protein